MSRPLRPSLSNSKMVRVKQLIAQMIVAFSLVLAAGLHHAYFIRYSYRTVPEPNKDKVWALAQIHFVSLIVVFMYVPYHPHHPSPTGTCWPQLSKLILVASLVSPLSLKPPSLGTLSEGIPLKATSWRYIGDRVRGWSLLRQSYI